MKFTETNINEAFAPLIENLVEQYVERTRKTVTHLKTLREDNKIQWVRLPYNYNTEDLRNKKMFESVMPCMKGEQADYRSPAIYSLCEEKLAKNADRWAHAQVDGMIAKTVGKIGDLDDVTYRFHGYGDFNIKGTVNGKQVNIDQQTVIKQSSKGTIFAQFPMRLYVEGQFTPAKAYNEAVA
jgi:hypothetical protein